MIKLTKITIDKYKCYTEPQTFDINSNVTVLVGMNESGKSALLEVISKTNYFEEYPDFKFDSYLRLSKKR